MLIFKRILFIGLAVLCLLPAINAPVALLVGLVFRNVLGDVSVNKLPKLTKWLLQASVVGLGFCINTKQAISAGFESFSLTALSVVAVLLLGLLLSKWLNLGRKLSLLISSGTAICGGSAIASMAPVINASNQEISTSLAVVFMLNALAVFIFPAIAFASHMTQHQFGLWCAVAIHDTSSVVGAASVYGQEALELATTAKLVRMLWILPLMLSVSLFKRNTQAMKFPWFVLLFVGALISSAFFPLPHLMNNGVFSLSKSMMSLVLFFMGATLTVKELKISGYQPLLFGVLLWVFIAVFSGFAIVAFY